jgi:hypothetical protein
MAFLRAISSLTSRESALLQTSAFPAPLSAIGRNAGVLRRELMTVLTVCFTSPRLVTREFTEVVNRLCDSLQMRRVHATAVMAKMVNRQSIGYRTMRQRVRHTMRCRALVVPCVCGAVTTFSLWPEPFPAFAIATNISLRPETISPRYPNSHRLRLFRRLWRSRRTFLSGLVSSIFVLAIAAKVTPLSRLPIELRNGPFDAATVATFGGFIAVT